MPSEPREVPHSVGVYGRTPLSQVTPGDTERRRAPRVRVRMRVPASFLTSSLPILIRNISVGGVLVESSEPFPVGTTHQLCLAADDASGQPPVMAAQSVYCQQELHLDGTPTFLTGFAFVAPYDLHAQRVVFELVDQVT